MQIAKSRRTLRINSGRRPGGVQRGSARNREVEMPRDSCGTRPFNLFDGALVPSQLFLEILPRIFPTMPTVSKGSYGKYRLAVSIIISN